MSLTGHPPACATGSSAVCQLARAAGRRIVQMAPGTTSNPALIIERCTGSAIAARTRVAAWGGPPTRPYTLIRALAAVAGTNFTLQDTRCDPVRRKVPVLASA